MAVSSGVNITSYCVPVTAVILPSFQAKVPGTETAPPLVNLISFSVCHAEPDAVAAVLIVGVAFLISTSTSAAGIPM